MRNNPKNNCTPKFAISARSAIRAFIHKPASGWVQIGINRAVAIQNGELCVPERAGKTIRVALAYIEIEGRIPVTLRNLTISEWKISDSGFADQAKQMSRIAEMIDGGIDDLGKIIPTSKDVEAIKLHLGIGT